jgi:small subunit ribosomal protein S7
MSRYGKTPIREIVPDTKYNDVLVSKLINSIMRRGKKLTAQRIVYRAFDIIAEKKKENPLTVFYKAFENIKPVLETRPRRVGGATYQVPMEIPEKRRVSLALRWLVAYSNERAEYRMEERLANEILDALENKGGAIKKKEDTHKMAEANRAFAHYRW